MTTQQIGALTFNEAGDDFGLGFGIVSARSQSRTPSDRGTFYGDGAGPRVAPGMKAGTSRVDFRGIGWPASNASATRIASADCRGWTSR